MSQYTIFFFTITELDKYKKNNKQKKFEVWEKKFKSIQNRLTNQVLRSMLWVGIKYWTKKKSLEWKKTYLLNFSVEITDE